MRTFNHTLHSTLLDADLDVIAYGDAGRPVIVLPNWDFTCTNWENNGMLDALYELVNAGGAQLWCTDSTDASGWYGRSLDATYRHHNVTAYLDFVERDLVPLVAKNAKGDERPLLAGVGIGALNATLLLLRHPEYYGGLLALSGVYDIRSLVDDFDDEWGELSPVDVASALPTRGKVVRTLKGIPLAFVCGQDASEVDIEGQRALDTIFAEKKVEATFEYWGYDVGRSWDWWQEQARQLLPCLLDAHGLAERKLMRRVSVAEIEVDHATEVLERGEADLADLRERLAAAREAVAAAEKRHESERQVVASCAEEADRLAALAREAWVERERVARLLAEAQAKGDEAQAAADAAYGDLSTAEWICGEAQAEAEASKARQSTLEEQLDRAVDEVDRARVEYERVSEALAQVNADIEAERAAEKPRATSRPRRSGARKQR